MKKLILALAFLMLTANLQAQKLYLSGIYNAGSIQYLNNGKYQKTPLKLNDFTYDNNTDIAIFGEFKKDEKGNSIFSIETEDMSVQLFSGNYKKVKYKCPGTPDEGVISLSTGKNIYYSSFVPLSEQGNISVRKGEWGIKVCENKIYSMYYIREINNNSADIPTIQHPTRPPLTNGGAEKDPISSGNTGSLVSVQDAKDALAFHNKARKDVGVAPLIWSAEISRYAQDWANNLANNGGCQLRHRSSSENTKGYGENIALGYSGYNALDSSKAWYSEIKDFQNVVLDNSNWYAAGHYTQMVWRKTAKVGIGIAKCTNGASIIVANYDPPGNYMGEKAY